ncbi:MAG: hypothetical protein LUG23_09535 [Oscillospiraceae bacterium]|nr:hypothetical protein [Oscillospiraceae bacterium]
MTYYKAFDPDFRDECDIQYAIGKETIVENPYQPDFIYAWGRCDTKLEACVRDLPMLMGYCRFDAKPHICEVEPNGKMVQRDDIVMRKQISYYLTNRITVTRELTVDETMQRLWDEGANFNSFITAHAPFEELMKLKEHFNNIDTVRRILSLPYLTDKQFRELLPQKYHKYIDDWYWI